jgi:hypothetical protein
MHVCPMAHNGGCQQRHSLSSPHFHPTSCWECRLLRSLLWMGTFFRHPEGVGIGIVSPFFPFLALSTGFPYIFSTGLTFFPYSFLLSLGGHNHAPLYLCLFCFQFYTHMHLCNSHWHAFPSVGAFFHRSSQRGLWPQQERPMRNWSFFSFIEFSTNILACICFTTIIFLLWFYIYCIHYSIIRNFSSNPHNWIIMRI